VVVPPGAVAGSVLRLPWLRQALAAAGGFEGLQYGLSAYLLFGHYNNVYGTLGAVIAFMFFVCLASMVFLSGAEIAWEYPRLGGGAPGGRQRRPPTYVAARVTGTMARRTSVAAVYLAAGIVVALASIAVALLVTPMQPVSVAGRRSGSGRPRRR
jgi:Virulence factor BrkB